MSLKLTSTQPLTRFERFESSRPVIAIEFLVTFGLIAIDALSDLVVAIQYFTKGEIRWGIACIVTLLASNELAFALIWCNRKKMQNPSPCWKAIPFIPIYEFFALLPMLQLINQPSEIRHVRLLGERTLVCAVEFLEAVTEAAPQFILQMCFYYYSHVSMTSPIFLLSIVMSCLSILKAILKYVYLRFSGATKFGAGLFIVGRSKECSTNPFFELTIQQPGKKDFKGIGDEGAEALAEVLPALHNLVAVSFRDIGTSGAKAIAAVLPQGQRNTLVSLAFENGAICFVGASAIAMALPQLPRLEIFRLVHNDIGTSGIRSIADVIASCPKLTCLDLSGNKVGSTATSTLFCALPNCKTLTTVGFAKNMVGNDGALAISSNLPRCTRLTSLDLSDNNIGEKGAKILAEALGKTPSVKTVDLRKNELGDAGALALFSACSKTCMIRMC